MRSKEEQKKAVEEARAKGAKLGQEHGQKINRQLRKTGAVARSAAEKTATTAAKGAKKTQELLVKTVHHLMGSDEYKKKATEVNERLAAVVQSLEDSITRRDIEIDRLRKRVAELEGGSHRG